MHRQTHCYGFIELLHCPRLTEVCAQVLEQAVREQGIQLEEEIVHCHVQVEVQLLRG